MVVLQHSSIKFIADKKYRILVCFALIFLFATIATDISNVLSMHWSWLDSQSIVGGQMWPPESNIIRIHASMGRDWTGFGVFFRALSLIMPVDNTFGMRSYYFVNYMFHVANVFLSGKIIKTLTQNYLLALITMVIIAVASSGPEAYLNLLHSELQGTFWVLCVCHVLVTSRLGVDYFWHSKLWIYMFMFSCGFLATGFFGKEPLVLFWLALITTIVVLKLKESYYAKREMIYLLDILLPSSLGVIAYWVYRAAIGVASPLAGSYSRTFLHVPNIERIVHHFALYLAYCEDIIIITITSCLLLIVFISDRCSGNSRMSCQELIACGLIVFANLYLTYYIVFAASVQFYYMYPVIFAATTGGAILLRALGFPMLLRAQWMYFVVLGGVGYSLLFGATHWYARSRSLVVVTSAMHALLDTIAELPNNSLVVVPFAKNDERINNLPVLLSMLYGRSDLRFGTLGEMQESILKEILLNCDTIWKVSLINSPQNHLIGTRELTSWAESGQNGKDGDLPTSISGSRTSVTISRELWVSRAYVVPSIVSTIYSRQVTWNIHWSVGWLVTRLGVDDYLQTSNNSGVCKAS